jgi:hypothetical protein
VRSAKRISVLMKLLVMGVLLKEVQ